MSEPGRRRPTGGYLERPAPSGLADVVRVILDKGIVIDAYAEVSLLGIELLTVDARVTIASADTYLRFAEAANRLDVAKLGGKGLPELAADATGKLVEGVAERVVEHAVTHAVDTAKEKAGEAVEKVSDKVSEKVEGATGTVVGKLADAAETALEKLEGKAEGPSRDGGES